MKKVITLEKLATRFDVLTVIVDKQGRRIDGLETKLDKLTTKVDGIAVTLQDFIGTMQVFAERMDTKFEKIDARFDKIENNMATKSYVDYKIADLKGDLMLAFKKTDVKANNTINLLGKKRVFSPAESKRLQNISPFAS